MATTTCHGTRDQLSSRPSTLSPHPRDHPTSLSDSHSRMSTKLVVSVPSQSAVLRLVSSRRVSLSTSPQCPSLLKSSPSRCITKKSTRLSQVTTSDSTSEVSPLRTSREVMSLLTQRTTQPLTLRTSSPRLSSLTIQVRSTLDTLPSSIATLATLPASSRRSSPRLTSVMVRSSKRSRSSSSPRKPPWSDLCHRSLWSLRHSHPTLPSVDSPLET